MQHFNVQLMIVFALACNNAFGQERVGINTSNPDRTLEINGSGLQLLRIHSTSFFGNEAGLELIRGDNVSNARDWKVTNDAGILKFSTSTNNFTTEGYEKMRISTNGFVGIGTQNPLSRLHVAGDAGVPDGIVLIGQKSSANLIITNNGIMARNNGNPAPLYLQSWGGNTTIANAGSGNIYLGLGGGNVGIGTAAAHGRLNVKAHNFQIYLRNENTSVNDWYIGTSDASWSVGDYQLVFSPTSSSSDAPLRLMYTNENDGVNAPVIIASGESQHLLLDGNEIDSKFGALHINHNSDHDTYINPTGGSVSIGTTSSLGRLDIKTNAFAIGLEQGNDLWRVTPLTDGNLAFSKDNMFVSLVEPWTGTWIALSDQRLKRDIAPMQQVMNRIRELPVYTYSFIHSDTQRDIGVIAQDLEVLFPEVVSKSDGQYGVAYDQLAVLAIKGVQEQQAQLESMDAQLDAIIAKR